MRRVATVLMAGGCILAGALAWGAAAPAGGAVVMPARGAVGPAREAAALAAGAGTRRVAFAGYTIDVPAGWPVYRLARDPYRCVRYDQNAVYLGQPGANQQCPAHLAGRVATLSLAKAHLTVSERRQLPPGGAVAWDSADHEMGALLPRPALSITATYGAAKGQIKDILATLRRAATGQLVGIALVRGALLQGPLAGLSGAGRQAAPRAGLAAAGAGLLPGQPARGHPHKRHHKCHYRCCHHRLCHP